MIESLRKHLGNLKGRWTALLIRTGWLVYPLGYWEVVCSTQKENVAVRWSEPCVQGVYLYVGHWQLGSPASLRTAYRLASEMNDAKTTPVRYNSTQWDTGLVVPIYQKRLVWYWNRDNNRSVKQEMGELIHASEMAGLEKV